MLEEKAQLQLPKVKRSMPRKKLRRRGPLSDQHRGRNYNKESAAAVGNRRRTRTPSWSSLSSSSYERKSLKRRRLLSPEEFSLPSGVPQEETSPSARDRIRVIQSPIRRHQEIRRRRREVRSDLTKRLDNFSDKSSDTGPVRDEGSYGRHSGNLRAERLTPDSTNQLRAAPHQYPRHEMTSNDQERNRRLSEQTTESVSSSDHEECVMRTAIKPPSTTPGRAQMTAQSNDPLRLLETYTSNDHFHSIDRWVHKTLQYCPAPEYNPRILKSQDALVKKYRNMNHSRYIDMWVDNAAKPCVPPRRNVDVVWSQRSAGVPSTPVMVLNDSVWHFIVIFTIVLCIIVFYRFF